MHAGHLEVPTRRQAFRSAAASLRALWSHRRFIWDSAVGDLRNRYAGSGFGAFWNVLTPLAMLTLYAFIFASVMGTRIAAGGMSTSEFVMYLSSGFLPWSAFADGLARGTQSLVLSTAYLKRMPIPEHVFVAQAAVSALLGMLINVVLLVSLALVLAQSPRFTWLLLPLVAGAWQAFGFGLSLSLAALNVFFRDISQALGVLLQIWMWSLPVVYLEDVLPATYRQFLIFNPAYSFLKAFRSAYLGAPSDITIWLSMLGWLALATLVGFFVMGRLRGDIRDAL